MFCWFLCISMMNTTNPRRCQITHVAAAAAPGGRRRWWRGSTSRESSSKTICLSSEGVAGATDCHRARRSPQYLGDRPRHGLGMKLGREACLSLQPPRFPQNSQSSFMLISTGQRDAADWRGDKQHRERLSWHELLQKVQKRPESQGIAIPHHFILSVFFLPPQKGGKATGFKAGNGTASALHLRRSRGVLPLASIDGELGSRFGA